jgi:protein-S-isoprenylcysteine O-methyltransferase Ste14
MSADSQHRVPHFGLLIPAFITLYTAVSAGLTILIKLPWHMPMSLSLALGIGAPILILGFGIILWAGRTLSLRRAMGKELFLDKSESKLITGGPYAYVRNPLYFGVLVCFLGWFLLLRLTPLGFLTVIFAFHFYGVAKWEEGELKRRFGQEYTEYAKQVPLFFPRFRRTGENKNKD